MTCRFANGRTPPVPRGQIEEEEYDNGDIIVYAVSHSRAPAAVGHLTQSCCHASMMLFKSLSVMPSGEGTRGNSFMFSWPRFMYR